MSKYVPDIASRRWVIISPHRSFRPEDESHKKHHKVCIFCPGHEKRTPNEVYRIGPGVKDKPGWKVRVIPNKYPITDIHEVIIHSPDDKKEIEDLPLSHVELIIQAYKHRFNEHKNQGQVLIFSNQGEHAGASIKHPHSQLVVIPRQINLDSLTKEPLNNMVDENKFFHVYCPDFSQWPYEVWISAKKEGTLFGDIEEKEITDLAQLLQSVLKQLKSIYKENGFVVDFGYNFYIYPKENWFMRIIPRFIHRAGFELGTGLSVNIVDPIDAALALKGVEKRMKNVMEKLRAKSGKLRS